MSVVFNPKKNDVVSSCNMSWGDFGQVVSCIGQPSTDYNGCLVVKSNGHLVVLSGRNIGDTLTYEYKVRPIKNLVITEE